MRHLWTVITSSTLLIMLIVLSTSHAGIFQKERQVEQAIFAAGCFWGVEKIFSKIDGVTHTDVGYAGGQTDKPDYHSVTSGSTGHAEAIRIQFDPQKVSYDQLLAVFFQWHDPTTLNRQGPDRGSQYRSAIFTIGEEQNRQAHNAVEKLNQSGIYQDPIVTEITDQFKYFAAENYHQKYLEKNPNGYCSHFLQKKEIPEILGVTPISVGVKS